MRSCQGLLFLAIAIFGLKWEFVWPTKPNQGIPAITTVAPIQPSFLWWEGSVLTLLGVYFLVTGDWAHWRGQKDRFSGDTFLAATSCFVAIFLRKFSYSIRTVDPIGVYPPFHGFYPPFDSVTLGSAWLLLNCLGTYYLVRGEFAFWGLRRGNTKSMGNPRP